MSLQERAVITRNAIIRGAAEVFAEHSYAQASLSDIVARANVTKGALYFHFKSKEELASAVIDEQHKAVLEGAVIVAAMGRSALDTLVLLSVDFCRQLLDDVVVRAGIRLTLEGVEVGRDLRALYSDWVASTEGIIDRGIADGILRPVLPAADLARYMVGAFTGVQLVSEMLAERSDLLERVEHLWSLLVPAMVAPHLVEEASSVPAKLFAEFGVAGIRD
ncbi:ScbR family autoregulator-binding transcription factor [Sinomonas sp. ASV322]|uniref:ScbR family autoregulator-binding transcription factor n=1 Tax=Sinomonas sp. ASV322 TaxID=3041920 RepID=UPI0027DAFB82|nr:ScbR family autoregulator-binding transcription factor [Sinomonas sp. ASV322]MDQ4501345.1 ScbR family autoregulator-binding transcription factor [Sinomonas sp. ASV322]